MRSGIVARANPAAAASERFEVVADVLAAPAEWYNAASGRAGPARELQRLAN